MNPHDIDILIGQNLRRIRTEKGLSQENLGKLINNAKTKISALENGKEGLGKELMAKICTALKIKPAEFYVQPDIDLDELPSPKKDVLTKLFQMTKDMNTEDIREVLKYAEKEKLWTERKLKPKEKAS